MASAAKHVVLIEADEQKRSVLAGRLQAQGFRVESFGEPSEAANWTLANPPHAVIADVWMPGISGVQLCRLLRSEPSTSEVPIVLRAEGNAPKARFWAEQAGATAYVPKGRIGDLVRTLNRAIAEAGESDGFFTQLAQGDIRDRIAQQLDRALFESVISSSVRALGTCESFSRLFDLFSQFVCRVATYRWLAVATVAPERLALHSHPNRISASLRAAQEALGSNLAEVTLIEDEDAIEDGSLENRALVHDIRFGSAVLGRLAVCPVMDDREVQSIIPLIASELGGPLRMAMLVEESQRLALYDPLTGIMNRRAFVERVSSYMEQADLSGDRLSCILLDVDHFKLINDTYGHKAGDRVLGELGRVASGVVPENGAVARWGGEEFVVALPSANTQKALALAEQLRLRIESHIIRTDTGYPIPVTASLGVATLLRQESFDSLVERADSAMYAAKVAGRNRVEVAADEIRVIPLSLRTCPMLPVEPIRSVGSGADMGPEA